MPDDKAAKLKELQDLLIRVQVADSFESLEMADRISELAKEVLIVKSAREQPEKEHETQVLASH